MKKMMLTVAAALAAVAMTGCFTVNTNDATVTPCVKLPKTFTPEITVQQQKVSGTASAHCLFGFITWGVSEFADNAFVSTTTLPVMIATPSKLVKQGATFNACQNAKADYILGAKYRVDTKNYFIYKQITCRVTGFPATIKSIK